jgi:hypothetical protein
MLLVLIAFTEVTFALTIQELNSDWLDSRYSAYGVLLYSWAGTLKALVVGACGVVYIVFPFIQTYRDMYLSIFGSVVSLNEGLFLALQALPAMYDQPSHYMANAR